MCIDKENKRKLIEMALELDNNPAFVESAYENAKTALYDDFRSYLTLNNDCSVPLEYFTCVSSLTGNGIVDGVPISMENIFIGIGDYRELVFSLGIDYCNKLFVKEFITMYRDGKSENTPLPISDMTTIMTWLFNKVSRYNKVLSNG